MAKILIIDDEEVTRDVIQEVLTLWGHEPILEAQDCEIGLELFHQASPDLVICDILMPGIGGLETIRRMKEENPASKIMAMTALGESFLSDALEAGADRGIEKPFDIAELKQVVQELLQDRAGP